MPTCCKKYILIILIVILGFSLRIVALTDNPPSLNWDEVSHGYNAYSILTTGRDEWGEVLPVIFRAYGDYKLPVYIYLTALSEALIGLNPVAVRLPSVLAGTLTILFTYLLVKQLFEEKKENDDLEFGLPLVSAFLVAIEPWSLFLSQPALEANLALTLIVGGVYFFLKARKIPQLLIPSSVFFGLSVWTYNSARIFVPLIIIVLIYLFWNNLKQLLKEHKLLVYGSLFVVIIFNAFMFWQLFDQSGTARYNKVSLIDDGAIGQIISLREKYHMPQLLERVLFNRPTYFVVRFIGNWLSHYDLRFLYLRGGSNYQFSVPNFGLLYLFGLPFFVLGIYFCVLGFLKKDKSSQLLVCWLILGPVASSLTRESPHVLRSLTTLPIPMILTAIGFIYFVRIISRNGSKVINVYSGRLVTLIFLIVFLLSASKYLKVYFNSYRIDYSWSWQYGYKNLISYLKQNYQKYDKIIITKKYGEPHEFILFYWPWNSNNYQADNNLKRFYQSGWYWVDRFDKFYFVNDWDIPTEEWQVFKLESGGLFNCSEIKCLLVTSPNNYPKRWTKVKDFAFLDGKTVFELYEN